MPRRPGSPIDHMPTADQLPALVVRPGPQPLLHGYEVEEDLARHYEAGELTLLALTGEAPEDEQAKRFSVACAFASALCAADAPVHAALLARRYGTRDGGVASVAAIGLAELARSELDAREALLSWLHAGAEGAPPPGESARGAADRQRVERLRTALRGRGATVRELEQDWCFDAAIVVTLFACGLKQRWQLEAALVCARLPIAIAEAMAHERGDLNGYPINLPSFSLHDD